MKVVYFTDLHAHNYKQFDVDGSRLRNCLSVIADVYEYCRHNDIEVILFGGDLYNVQGELPTEVVNAVIALLQEMTEEYPNIKWYAISGNHDHASKNLIGKPAVSALAHLQTVYPNFNLIDDKHKRIDADRSDKWKPVVHGIPYYEYPEHFNTMLEARSLKAQGLKESGQAGVQILLIHQTPSGMPNKHIPIDTDVNSVFYKVFDLVLCGHIHTKQLITDNFLLGGSPLHKDLADEGQDKGFWEFDTRDPKVTLTFISLKGKYPEYVTVKANGKRPKEEAYVIEAPDVEQIATIGEASIEDFSAVLSPNDLLKNYWKQETGGKDKLLLQQGLEFVQ